MELAFLLLPVPLRYSYLNLTQVSFLEFRLFPLTQEKQGIWVDICNLMVDRWLNAVPATPVLLLQRAFVGGQGKTSVQG